MYSGSVPEPSEAAAPKPVRLDSWWFYGNRLVINLDSVQAVVTVNNQCVIYFRGSDDGVWLSGEYSAPLMAAIQEYQLWKIAEAAKGMLRVMETP